MQIFSIHNFKIMYKLCYFIYTLSRYRSVNLNYYLFYVKKNKVKTMNLECEISKYYIHICSVTD